MKKLLTIGFCMSVLICGDSSAMQQDGLLGASSENVGQLLFGSRVD
jgi:hypothetical protein